MSRAKRATYDDHLVFIGGGLLIHNFFGSSVPGFYSIVYEIMDVIIDKSKFHFPTSQRELDRASRDFCLLSDNSIMNGYVGCIDGLLVKTITPKEVQT